MKGKMKMKMGLMAVAGVFVLLSGCAVAPSWVRHESETFYCSNTPALYGVGRSYQHARGERVKVSSARINARRSVESIRKEYIKNVLLTFATQNDQWFDLTALEHELDDIANVANDRLRVRPVFIDQWQDTRYLPWERKTDRGTLFVLGELRIDDHFNRQLLESLDTSLRARGARVLKAEPDTVAVGLAEYLDV